MNLNMILLSDCCTPTGLCRQTLVRDSDARLMMAAIALVMLSLVRNECFCDRDGVENDNVVCFAIAIVHHASFCSVFDGPRCKIFSRSIDY